MADKLDKLIAEKREAVRRLSEIVSGYQQDLYFAEVELKALEAAAIARPAAEVVKRKGRQPGAISKEWRDVLRMMASAGPADYVLILALANEVGIEGDMANVRERVRTFVRNGLLKGTPEQGFTVTAEAWERFGWGSPPSSGQEFV